jgi:hypothetical protein
VVSTWAHPVNAKCSRATPTSQVTGNDGQGYPARKAWLLDVSAPPPQHQSIKIKSFLLLFFKKEVLPVAASPHNPIQNIFTLRLYPKPYEL